MITWNVTVIHSQTHVTRYFQVKAFSMKNAIALAFHGCRQGEILQYVDQNVKINEDGESSGMIGWLKD